MTTDKTTDLIERYLYAVGQELPRAQRADITNELRTLIEDKLEERARGQPSPPDAAVIAGVLEEIGDPNAVARRYDTRPQYLIGPRFYPAFLRIMKIILAAAAFVVLLTTLLRSTAGHGGAAPAFGLAALWTMFGMYFQVALSLFAWLVLVLAILERTGARAKPPAGPWAARDLPPVPAAEEDRVSVPGLTAESVLVLLILAVLNLAPQWVGVLMVTDGHPGFLPLADLGVRLPVLAINLWLAAAVGLKLIVLGQRRWTFLTRWLEVVVGVLAAAVLWQIVARSALHAPAGVPQLDPAMRLLGRLLFVAPFAVAIQPVLRVIRLLRPARPATPS